MDNLSFLLMGAEALREEEATAQFLAVEEYSAHFREQNVPLTPTNNSLLVDNLLRILFCIPQLPNFWLSSSSRNPPRKYWDPNHEQFVEDPATTVGVAMNAHVMSTLMNSCKFLIKDTISSKKWHHLYDTPEQKAIFETYFCSLLTSVLYSTIIFMILITK